MKNKIKIYNNQFKMIKKMNQILKLLIFKIKILIKFQILKVMKNKWKFRKKI